MTFESIESPHKGGFKWESVDNYSNKRGVKHQNYLPKINNSHSKE